MPQSKQDGVLTHENALREEAGKQSKLEQMLDNKTSNLLVDQESEKSLNNKTKIEHLQYG